MISFLDLVLRAWVHNYTLRTFRKLQIMCTICWYIKIKSWSTLRSGASFMGLESCYICVVLKKVKSKFAIFSIIWSSNYDISCMKYSNFPLFMLCLRTRMKLITIPIFSDTAQHKLNTLNINWFWMSCVQNDIVF